MVLIPQSRYTSLLVWRFPLAEAVDGAATAAIAGAAAFVFPHISAVVAFVAHHIFFFRCCRCYCCSRILDTETARKPQKVKLPAAIVASDSSNNNNNCNSGIRNNVNDVDSESAGGQTRSINPSKCGAMRVAGLFGRLAGL